MPSLRSLLFLALPLLTLALPERSVEEDQWADEDVAAWEELLRELPGESLKAAVEVNLRPKYREGVFEDGHDAIYAIHNDDPELASKLVELAKQDAMVKEYLKKRQDNNATTTVVTTTSPVVVVDSTTSAVSFTTETTTTPVTTASPTTEASNTEQHTSTVSVSTPITAATISDTSVKSTETGVLVPVQVTSTNAQGSAVVHTTQALASSAPTSVKVAITTTDSNGHTITTSSVAPAVLITSTNAQGSVITTASPVSNVAVAAGGSVIHSAASLVSTTDSRGAMVVLSSPSPGGVYTVTDANGDLVTVTYQPGGGTVSQLQVATSTLANGQATTITSFAEVGGQTAASQTGGAKSTGHPGLQSGASTLKTFHAAMATLLLGAFVVVAAVVL